jgi:hypothetical protein
MSHFLEDGMACSSNGEFETPQSMLESSYSTIVSLDHSLKCVGTQILSLQYQMEITQQFMCWTL